MAFAHPAERNELPPPGVSLPPRRLVEQLSRDYGQIAIAGLPGADEPDPESMATRPTLGAAVRPYGRLAEDAPATWAAGGLWSTLADGASTDGSYSLFDVLLRRGSEEPAHMHLGADEVVYMLEGEADVFLGGGTERAGKGSLVFIPRGTVHAFKVRSDTARLLTLHTPSGFERVVVQLGEAAPSRELPPSDWRPPEVPDDQRMRLFADLGLQLIAVQPFAAQ